MLTEAAINGAKDHLLGLKENVIIGKLIPAGIGRAAEPGRCQGRGSSRRGRGAGRWRAARGLWRGGDQHLPGRGTGTRRGRGCGRVQPARRRGSILSRWRRRGLPTGRTRSWPRTKRKTTTTTSRRSKRPPRRPRQGLSLASVATNETRRGSPAAGLCLCQWGVVQVAPSVASGGAALLRVSRSLNAPPAERPTPSTFGAERLRHRALLRRRCRSLRWRYRARATR